MNVRIGGNWKPILEEYFQTPEWKVLTDFVKKQYQEKTIYPHPTNLFKAFELTPFEKVEVIILGQDPYHGKGQAHGLCFSVPNGVTPPPSLKNIYKEIYNDMGTSKDISKGNLTEWAEQGVLLLNSVMTVEANKAGSHANKGWELFTDYVIKKISQEKEHCVFLLWGNYAKQKGSLIDRARHLVLESAHPSPFSADHGFFGNKHFSKANEYLVAHHKQPIVW